MNATTQPTESQPKELLRGPNGVIIPGAAHSWKFSGIPERKTELSAEFSAWIQALPNDVISSPDFGHYAEEFSRFFSQYFQSFPAEQQYFDSRATLICALHQAGIATIQQIEAFFAEHSQRISQDTTARRYALYQSLVQRHGEGAIHPVYFSGGSPEKPASTSQEAA